MKKFALDIFFISVPLAVAAVVWHMAGPIWLIVLVLLIALFAIVSLLGDLGVFSRTRQR